LRLFSQPVVRDSICIAEKTVTGKFQILIVQLIREHPEFPAQFFSPFRFAQPAFSDSSGLFMKIFQIGEETFSEASSSLPGLLLAL